jgi:hypothetical protein
MSHTLYLFQGEKQLSEVCAVLVLPFALLFNQILVDFYCRLGRFSNIFQSQDMILILEDLPKEEIEILAQICQILK